MDYQSWMSKTTENLAAAELCFEHDHFNACAKTRLRPMMLNHKQKDLLEQLVKEIETKFPEVKFVEAYQGLEGENSVWLDFTKPADEDRLIELGEYASERTTDILLDYGYHFVVLPVVSNGAVAATPTA